MSTVYENTVDTLREVGERLAHEVPSSLQTVRVPSGLIPAGVLKAAADWPEEITERVTGRRRKRGGTLRQHPVLVASGAVVLVLAVVWLVRRRRSDGVEQGLRVADESKAFGAA